MEDKENSKKITICVIDIGGTNFRSGVYKNGELLLYSLNKTSTPNFKKFSIPQLKTKITEKICESYIRCKDNFSDLEILAISFPGPVSEKGLIMESGVIFGGNLGKPFDLITLINQTLCKQNFTVPNHIKVTNDMTASAWRYSDYDYDPFCIITVSSGIGNKIFSNKKILIGSDGLAGEIGHHSVSLEQFSKPCFCGCGNNHIAAISSGWGIEIYAKELAQKNGLYNSLFLQSYFGKHCNYSVQRMNNEIIAQYADMGDIFAQKVIDFCSLPLANAIRLLCVALYLKKIILIGGFALNCNYYKESLIKNIIRERIYNFTDDDIKQLIIYGEHDDFHALIGLGKMIENELS